MASAFIAESANERPKPPALGSEEGENEKKVRERRAVI
jgi:hypothetical protein